MTIIRTRHGKITKGARKQDRLLAWIYGTSFTRFLLKPFVQPWFSRLCGAFLDSSCSRILIRSFVKSAKIDLSQYEPVKYKSYNEFFCRKIRKETRPVDQTASHLIAPCDSKLTVYALDEQQTLRIKHTQYSLKDLLKEEELAEKYANGIAMVFRLTVDDYHRYCYIDEGEKTENRFIKGILHTVNPVANDHYPIYKENCREYSVLHSKNFGDVVMVEVGALLVGKIVNHHETAVVHRGEEKGYFQFGGSTVVLLFEKDRVYVDEDILNDSLQNIETIVKMGERIGCAKL